MVATSVLVDWGVIEAGDSREFVPLGLDLFLGSLGQSGHTAMNAPTAPVTSLGGVRIDALISHAFLKTYAWTIDFDARHYVFSRS